jgi:uncharacterized protein YjbI with pentapeptide repeats
MENERPSRRTFDESCQILRELEFLDNETFPVMPSRRPRHDDEEPFGVSFFRTFLGESDLENLTLPRTFLARSSIGPLSFTNTDFSESSFNWNDFIQVDFTDVDLSGSDLRASNFTEVYFTRASLRDADLRCCSFNDCDFKDADMRGAKLTRIQGESIPLSEEQRQKIDWQDSDGDEPEGG